MTLSCWNCLTLRSEWLGALACRVCNGTNAVQQLPIRGAAFSDFLSPPAAVLRCCSYLQRFQGLILTACGLGMASGNLMSVEEPSCSMTPPGHAHLHHLRVTKRWLLTA